LFFDVFTRYDPENLLLDQARREVLAWQLEVRRLSQAMEEAQTMKIVQIHTQRLTPLSFPLWAMWVQGQVSTEQWGDRVRRMAEQLEAAAGQSLSP
jgi:ATP-dependent Lhr-like helicase